MSAPNREYALGRSPREYARLAMQAELLRPMTRRAFDDAGVTTGMRVLDLGSGAGDVCMLLAEMVGPTGAVIGLDVDGDAVGHGEDLVELGRDVEHGRAGLAEGEDLLDHEACGAGVEAARGARGAAPFRPFGAESFPTLTHGLRRGL